MGLLLPLVMTFFSPSFRSSYTNKDSSYEFQMVDGNLGMGNRNNAVTAAAGTQTMVIRLKF